MQVSHVGVKKENNFSLWEEVRFAPNPYAVSVVAAVSARCYNWLTSDFW